MSEVLKWLALGDMTQRSRIGGGTYVLLADFDAEHALRLEAERQVGELREQLAYEVADHRTTQICRDGWRNNCEEANARLVKHVEFLLHVKKCLVRNGEYSPLSHQELDTLAGINPCLNTTSTEGKGHE